MIEAFILLIAFELCIILTAWGVYSYLHRELGDKA